MAGLISSLGASVSALNAHGKAVELAGKNLANINNPDYARQRVVYGSLSPVETDTGPFGGILMPVGVEHIRDVFLDTQLLREISLMAGLDTESFHLDRLLSVLGDSVDRLEDPQFIEDSGAWGTGLRHAIDAFFNSFESFAARPSNEAARIDTLNAAQNLVAAFNQTDDRLEALLNAANAELESRVDAFNADLRNLDRLNREIARLELGRPGAATDLRDQRQALLEKLAESAWIEVEEVHGSNGAVAVTVRDADGGKITLVAPEMTPAVLTFDSESRSFGLAGRTETVDLRAGKLHSAVKSIDGALAESRARIDDLARELTEQVNGIYEVTGRNFFDPAGVTAGTLALDDTLTLASLVATETAISGANELALGIAGLAGLRSGALGGSSFSEFAARTVTRIGHQAANVEASRKVQREVEAFIKQRRSEVSGVSLDEEVARMTQAQRAFQASSRVFNVISEMLETIVTGLR